MAEVWTSKSTTGTTSWIGSTGTTSSTWTDADAGSSAIGISTAAGQSLGVYDSAEAAATALIGTKYHLFDRKEFMFGDDSDIRLSFDADNSGLLLRVFPPLSGGGTLFTIRNGGNDTFRVMGDNTLRMRRSYSTPDGLSENHEVGLVFYNNELWVSL